MKKNYKQELTAKDLSALKKLLVEKNKELFDNRMDKEIGKLKNVRILFHQRKEIAFLKTLITQKEQQ